MLFPQPLLRARLVRRYKRFLADVVLEDGSETTAHTPNPGAMMGLSAPGSVVWCSRSSSPKRKLALTLEMVEADGGLVGVNTQHPNRLVAEALRAGALEAFSFYVEVRPEVVIETGSRLDFVLRDATGARLLLEVKNCHLKRGGRLAEFPDCRAERSSRHARLLARLASAGERCAIAFVVQRMDCDAFSPAADIDPDFASALREARDAGVGIFVYGCDLDLEGVAIRRRLDLVL